MVVCTPTAHILYINTLFIKIYLYPYKYLADKVNFNSNNAQVPDVTIFSCNEKNIVPTYILW